MTGITLAFCHGSNNPVLFSNKGPLFVDKGSLFFNKRHLFHNVFFAISDIDSFLRILHALPMKVIDRIISNGLVGMNALDSCRLW